MIEIGLPAGDLEILCLGAHPDDVEIGCGASLLSMAQAWAAAGRTLRASVLLLTGNPLRQAEARSAATAFLPGVEVSFTAAELPDGRLPAHWDDAKNALETLAKAVSPDIIFGPRPDDAHQDHRMLSELIPTVWRDSLVLQYEIPKWDGDLGSATHYVAVSDEVATAKVSLLNEHYPSQLGRDWWTDDLFLAVLRLRGMQCRNRYAEAFTVSKANLNLQPGVRT